MRAAASLYSRSYAGRSGWGGCFRSSEPGERSMSSTSSSHTIEAASGDSCPTGQHYAITRNERAALVEA
jgi:hypothetical protein